MKEASSRPGAEPENEQWAKAASAGAVVIVASLWFLSALLAGTVLFIPVVVATIVAILGLAWLWGSAPADPPALRRYLGVAEGMACALLVAQLVWIAYVLSKT